MGHAPQWGATPIGAAATGGHAPVVRFLIEVGADANATDIVSGRRVPGEGQGMGESRKFWEW